MLDILQKFNEYDKEKLIKIVKIYINNPFLDLRNCIYMFEQGLNDNEIIKQYDEKEAKIIYIYGDNIENIKYYSFEKKPIESINEEISFNNIIYKFFNKTHIKVKINNEIDINKKECFIKDDILYVSDLIDEKRKCYVILSEFIDLMFNNCNNIGAVQLCKIMLKYKLEHNNIELTPLIYNTIDINKIYIFSLGFNMYFETINVFYKHFLALEDLFMIDNTADLEKNNYLNIKYDKETLIEIKNDINSGNLPDYPYYYL